MSQYPLNNTSDLVEAVNYLLSGPTSIGQNFQGVSAVANPANDITSTYKYDMFTNAMAAPFTTNSTVTGNNIIPSNITYWPQLSSIDYYATTPPGITVPNIVINNITAVSNDVIEVDVTVNPIYIDAPLTTNTEFIFTKDGSHSPLSLNQKVTISGVTPSVYNGDYRVGSIENYPGPFPGPIQLVRLDGVQTWTTYTSGGQISWQQQNVVTDLFAAVTVTGPTDRVFVTCQAPIKGYVYNPNFLYLDVGLPPVTYNLKINRYRAIKKTTLPNGAEPFPYIYNGYVWEYDSTLVDVPYNLFANADQVEDGYTYFKPEIPTFNNVIDNPGIGYFLYTFEVYFDNQYNLPYDPSSPNIQPIVMATYGFRSFTAQVIKE